MKGSEEFHWNHKENLFWQNANLRNWNLTLLNYVVTWEASDIYSYVFTAKQLSSFQKLKKQLKERTSNEEMYLH